MIGKYLTNMNNLIQYIIMFLILLLIIYLIYKIFIVENDVYILNERLSKIELQINNSSHTIIENSELDNNDIEMANVFMKEVFTNPTCKNKISEEEEPSTIDIDEIIKEDIPESKEELFDLKKDIITTEDNTSIISSSNNKKKLQKLNLDKLKEKCQEMGLSQEGTKANLIEKILDENNKGV